MEFSIRNYRPAADEDALLAISAACDAADRVERRLTPDDLRHWLGIPGVRPEFDFFVAEAEGRPVGYAGFDVQTGSLERHTAFCNGEVHPAYRRQGVGAALIQTVERRAAEVLAGRPAGYELHFEAYCRSTQTDVDALYRARGMRPARTFLSMERPLAGELPAPAAPEGFTIRAYRDEDDEALRIVFADAFQDHWGYEPMSLDDWRHFIRDVPYFKPELWLLGWQGGELAGFSLNFVDPTVIAQAGRLEGKVGEVGVRRASRRRGLANALLAASFQALRAAGMEWAGLGVDADSLTDAVRVYERLGFTTRWKNVVYRKNL